MSEVNGHVSTQNGSQICPSTPFGGFLWTLSNQHGSFQSFSKMYVPNIILEIASFVSMLNLVDYKDLPIAY